MRKWLDVIAGGLGFFLDLFHDASAAARKHLLSRVRVTRKKAEETGDTSSLESLRDSLK